MDITIKTTEAGQAKVYAADRKRLLGKVYSTKDYSSSRTGVTWVAVTMLTGQKVGYGHQTRTEAVEALVKWVEDFDAKKAERLARRKEQS